MVVTIAALQGDVVTLLIRARALPSARTAAGDSALMAASLGGNSNIVRLLLAGGADVTDRGGAGMLPTHYAVTVELVLQIKTF